MAKALTLECEVCAVREFEIRDWKSGVLAKDLLGDQETTRSILELKGHFTRTDHLEVDERKNNRSMRISTTSEPLLMRSSKRDLEAAIFKARFRKELLDIGQKEVNRTWWQPPLSFDSWKPVQSWSLILQWKQTLTQERNLEREKLGTNFYLQLQIALKGNFTRADHLEVDERKNNRLMRISADDRYQQMPRQMKINIDGTVPSIDVETPDATFWIQQT
ncbi:hypothetical protein YC2023_108176 [Brassica napus]